MSDSNDYNPNAGLSSTVTGEITVAMVVILFMLFAVAFIWYLRTKGYSGTTGLSRSQSRHQVFTPNQPNSLKQPLDPAILNSLHFTLFRSEDFEEEGGLECAVCLSELRDGEKARLLPKCRHGFHVECIDMWFQSNSTCPLCRNTVGAVEIPIQHLEVVSETGRSAESQNTTTSLDEGSSSSGCSFSEKRQKGMLVIEIPSRAVEGFSSTSNARLPTSRMPAEGIKSPALERLRSLRRILSRGNLNGSFVGSSCSPRCGDIEQGTVAATVNQKSSESASYS